MSFRQVTYFTMKNQTSHRAASTWVLVLLLLVIAFWRTVASERSAQAIRLVFDTRTSVVSAHKAELEAFSRLRETIQSEKIALLRLRVKFKTLNYSAVPSTVLYTKRRKRRCVVGAESQDIEKKPRKRKRASNGGKCQRAIQYSDSENEILPQLSGGNERKDLDVNSNSGIGEHEYPLCSICNSRTGNPNRVYSYTSHNCQGKFEFVSCASTDRG